MPPENSQRTGSCWKKGLFSVACDNVPASKPPEILVRPRIYIGDAISLGPGKLDLLRLIDARHSIAAAARELHIPYKRAWFLINTLNQGFPTRCTLNLNRDLLSPSARRAVRSPNASRIT